MKIKIDSGDILKPKRRGEKYRYRVQKLKKEMKEIEERINGLTVKDTKDASSKIQEKLETEMGYEKDKEVAEVLRSIGFKTIKTKHNIDLVNISKKIAIEIEMTKSTNLLTDLIKLSIASKSFKKKKAIEHGLIIVQKKYKTYYEMVPALKNYFKLMSSAYWPYTLGWISIELTWN